MSRIYEEILERLEKLESVAPERLMDHSGIAIGTGEGLSGGGTIDQTQSITLSFESLEERFPNLGTEFFAFYDKVGNQHYRVKLNDLAERIMQFEGITAEIERLKDRVAGLEAGMRLLSIWDRVARLEKKIDDE